MQIRLPFLAKSSIAHVKINSSPPKEFAICIRYVDTQKLGDYSSFFFTYVMTDFLKFHYSKKEVIFKVFSDLQDSWEPVMFKWTFSNKYSRNSRNIIHVWEDESLVDIKSKGDDVLCVLVGQLIGLLGLEVLPQELLIIGQLNDQRHVKHVLKPPVVRRRGCSSV